MVRINTYILTRLVALFGFFALVLVLIYWVNRAVRLFDRLIADGQSAIVFLEFTALTLPWMISVISPIAGFAAVVYVINRLTSNGELVVLQTAGLSARICESKPDLDICIWLGSFDHGFNQYLGSNKPSSIASTAIGSI